MQCSESFSVRDIWFNCKNPASIIAKDYKYGNEVGICSFCLWRLDKEDDSNFFQRYEIKDK